WADGWGSFVTISDGMVAAGEMGVYEACEAGDERNDGGNGVVGTAGPDDDDGEKGRSLVSVDAMNDEEHQPPLVSSAKDGGGP
ncbi:hypothetical protein GGI22_001626, partial [Coemansia erecta]